MENNTNNNRFNSAMAAINVDGIKYIQGSLERDKNARFVCAIARLNTSGRNSAFIGTSKSGKEIVTVPVVADYADKAAKYAGLSDDENGAGLFYSLMLSGNLAGRYAKLLREGKLRAGTEFMLTGVTAMRESTGRDGKVYRNPTVYCSTLEITRWGKKENASIAVHDNSGVGAAPAAQTRQTPAQAPAYQAPSTTDDMELLSEDDDLPF